MGDVGSTATFNVPPRPMLRLLAVLAIALGALTGCGSDEAYVGTWRPASGDTLGRRYSFYADGTARIIVRPPVGEPQSFSAQYTVAGDSLLTLSDDQGTERFQVRLDGDTLWLHSPINDQETAWVRM